MLRENAVPAIDQDGASIHPEPSALVGAARRGEPRWPATLAVLAAIGLYMTLQDIALPEQLTTGPTDLLPILEALLLVPLTIAAPRRQAGEPRWQRWASVAVIGLVNIANISSLVLLVDLLLRSPGSANGPLLLLAALLIWLTNVLVFALWYWELDRGGPDERAGQAQRRPDFLFPQMSNPACMSEHWTPSFMDYLYVSCTNATAFSPTGTMPLTAWAKMLMMIQSLTSLITVTLVAARAVNILH